MVVGATVLGVTDAKVLDTAALVVFYCIYSFVDKPCVTLAGGL